MLLKLSCKMDIIQSLIYRWENWGMLKPSSVPKAALTLTLRGFLSSVHSDFCVYMSVCACAYMFARAAAVSSGTSQGRMLGTWTLACSIPLTCSLGWVSGITLQGEVRGSFQGHPLLTLHGTFLLGANPHLLWFLLCRFHHPFRGNPDLHTKGFNTHTSFRSHSMLWGRPGFTQGRQKAWLIKTSQGI